MPALGWSLIPASVGHWDINLPARLVQPSNFFNPYFPLLSSWFPNLKSLKAICVFFISSLKSSTEPTYRKPLTKRFSRLIRRKDPRSDVSIIKKQKRKKEKIRENPANRSWPQSYHAHLPPLSPQSYPQISPCLSQTVSSRTRYTSTWWEGPGPAPIDMNISGLTNPTTEPSSDKKADSPGTARTIALPTGH